MNSYSTKSGSFDKRPYYKPREIEKLCLDELRAVDLLPSSPAAIRIDMFIEKRFKVIPEYDDIPDGVLGYTEFGDNKVQRVVISRKLDSDGSKQAECRIRTTMAHEGGHGLLHTALFTPHTTPLFGDVSDPVKPKVMCRDEVKPIGAQHRYDGRWWEYQANMVIAPLLLPKSLVEMALEPFLVKCGLFAMTIDDACRDEAIDSIAETFEVNPIVARIRLSDMYPIV